MQVNKMNMPNIPVATQDEYNEIKTLFAQVVKIEHDNGVTFTPRTIAETYLRVVREYIQSNLSRA